MQIRNDFQPASLILNRLVEYSKVFENNNIHEWPHLKNNEDFREVYSLPFEDRNPLEEIYATGRDLAVFMSSRLIEFNYAEAFPTLKSFIDSFHGGWIYQIDQLKDISQTAKNKSEQVNHCPWAIRQMIKLFDRQIDLLVAIKQCLESLKDNDLYKWEMGQGQITFQVPEYTRILECVHSVGKMFERLPSTYIGKDEESLRDHILVSLQSIVFGSATGETFNKRGKTDILVRGNGANEFVGECKFWKGKGVFLETISQLLSYLSWRDNKTAVILFVENKDFSTIVEKVREYIKEHPNYLRSSYERDETWQNYEFCMNDDRNRVVQVAIMLYHLA